MIVTGSADDNFAIRRSSDQCQYAQLVSLINVPKLFHEPLSTDNSRHAEYTSVNSSALQVQETHARKKIALDSLYAGLQSSDSMVEKQLISETRTTIERSLSTITQIAHFHGNVK